MILGKLKSNVEKLSIGLLRNILTHFRFSQVRVPLNLGEKLEGRIENLLIVQQNCALRLVANRDFKDGDVQR